MSDFRRQIKNDLVLIQRDWGHLDQRLSRDEFAFNYWILSRLYSLEEDTIPSHITEANDKNIDCFVHYEDTKELFLIQNKYYEDNTAVSRNDVADFLKTPLSVLLRGDYTRSPELQKIFNRIHQDSDYKIWLHFYVTNEHHTADIDGLFNEFQLDGDNIKAYVGAKYFDINDIRSMYFEDRFTEKTSFTAILPTRVRATSLDVRPEEYGLQWMVDLRYVMVNVADLYQVYKEAEKKNYALFEENIREYLGTKGINRGIIDTLKSSEDRENFFYYNNGLTLICEACETLDASTMPEKHKKQNSYYGFKLKNPQIVNGCQTINSIAEVLAHYDDARMYAEFAKVFVLVKIFVFDEGTKNKKRGLDGNIVRYTNSQNGISDKAFASKRNYFLNIQNEFLARGYLLLVKPSDRNIFNDTYSEPTKFSTLRKKAESINEKLDIRPRNLNDHMIPLEKLLRALLAFYEDAHAAYTKGMTVLKPTSNTYKHFSLNIETHFTVDHMLNIYLLYSKAENEKKLGDKRFPIPYYVLSFLGNACTDKDFETLNNKLDFLFFSQERFLSIYNFYKQLTATYAEEYRTSLNKDYGIMVKQEIDAVMFAKCFNMALGFYPDKQKIMDYLKY